MTAPAPANKRTLALPKLLLLIAALVYSSWGISHSLALLDGYALDSRDLAIFAQSMDSAAHGGLLRNSMEIHGLHIAGAKASQLGSQLEAGGISHFAAHFSPALFVLAPLYRLLPDPLTLQAIHVLALALVVIPLFLFARRRLNDSALAALLGIALLAHPLTLMVATEAFRENALAVPLLATLMLSLSSPRWWYVALALAATLATKEDLALPVFLLGVGLLCRRRWTRGAALMAAAALTLVVASWVMLVARDGVPSDHLLRYRHLGESLTTIALRVISHPVETLRLAWQQMPEGYLLHLLLPWLLLPLLSPYALLALPIVVINLLSNAAFQQATMSYSNILLVPILAFAAVDGLARVLHWINGSAETPLLASRPRHRLAVLAALTLALAVGSLSVTRAYWPAVQAELARRLTDKEQRAANGYIAAVPKKATVMASPAFLPRLAHRERRLFAPWKVPGLKVDYLLLFEGDRFPWPFKKPAARNRFIQQLLNKATHTGRGGRVIFAKLP